MLANDPHANGPVELAGIEPKDARLVVIMLHGRGATAASILSLADYLDVEGVAFVAPQAAGNTWYPSSFMAPLSGNQPHLDSALRRIDDLSGYIARLGVPASRQIVVGFSQGACLTCTYLATRPKRYAGAAALIGGIAGPEGAMIASAGGSLGGTPVFLGSSDPDPHVPFSRVRETDAALAAAGASTTLVRYPSEAHTVNADMIRNVKALVEGALP